MTRDPPPTIGDDAELDALLAAMKQDQAPPDLEARLLDGLAATSAAGAGAAAAKASLWHKLTLLLNAHGVVTSVLIGALCGGVVCGTYSLFEGPAGPAVAPPEIAASAAPPERAPGVPEQGPTPGSAPETPAAAERTPPVAAVPRSDAPPPAPKLPSTPAPSPSGAAGAGTADSPPDQEPAAASVTAGAQAVATPPGAPARPDDALRKELLQVRAIAVLVDAGRCAEARAAIAGYRAEHGSGQLAGEVDVLAARCLGR